MQGHSGLGFSRSSAVAFALEEHAILHQTHRASVRCFLFQLVRFEPEFGASFPVAEHAR